MRITSGTIACLLLAGLFCVAQAVAQERDQKVRKDREQFEESDDWIYNDLETGIREARAADKPLFVTFRCIPCEACQEFDDQVARRDPQVRDLMDQFVCVRIVQANRIDLTQFQFDFDQSFAAFFMHPDKTLYGRFGTRSKHEESRDISLAGLRKAMAAVLDMHKKYDRIKPALAGKQVGEVKYASPEEFPSLAGRYGEKIDYEGKTAASCLHCHQIRDAERLDYRTSGQPLPDEVLYPYPNPAVLGLAMDPKEKATVQEVAAGSVAARSGIKAGDEILTLAGQPLVSIADMQWVLHNSPSMGTLTAEVQRDDKTRAIELSLDEGWRRRDDISWRVSTWDLRRMGLGGLLLEELPDGVRREHRIGKGKMALLAKHVGEYGDHAVALRAGFRKGDILVSFDGRDDFRSESELLAYALQEKKPGDEVDAAVLRDGKRHPMRLALQ